MSNQKWQRASATWLVFFAYPVSLGLSATMLQFAASQTKKSHPHSIKRKRGSSLFFARKS
jgi:hypothetical protein